MVKRTVTIVQNKEKLRAQTPHPDNRADASTLQRNLYCLIFTPHTVSYRAEKDGKGTDSSLYVACMHQKRTFCTVREYAGYKSDGYKMNVHPLYARLQHYRYHDGTKTQKGK